MANRVKSVLAWPITRFKKLSLIKKILVVIVLIVVVSFAISSMGNNGQSNYVIEKVERADITQEVSETGNIDTGASIEVLSPSTGIVQEVYVSNGQPVNEGDILFTVESTATEQEQSASYSNYLAAQDALNTANAALYTLRATMLNAWNEYYDLATGDEYENEDGSPKTDQRAAPEFQVPQDTWTAAEKEYKDQQTAVGAAQARVNAAWIAYQATQNAEVKAHSTGTVSNLAVSRGKRVTAEDPALSISSDISNAYVNLLINEIDIPKIHEGQKAIVEIDAIDDEEFEGVVERVDTIGTNNQGVITYNVYVRLLETDRRIRSGMTANVDIITETVENVLSVPNSAVKPYQGGRAVQVLDPSAKEPKYIPVRVGLRGNERTEILEGLEEGQEIVVAAKNAAIGNSSFGF